MSIDFLSHRASFFVAHLMRQVKSKFRPKKLKNQGYLVHTAMDLNMDSNKAYARQGHPDQACWSITSEGEAFLKGLSV